MLYIGWPEDLLDIVLIQVLLFWRLDYLHEYLLSEDFHVFLFEFLAEQHPHNFIKVQPIDFLVFIYIENPKVKLYFLIYASSWVEQRHYFGEFSEVDICFRAHQLDEGGVVISVELVPSVF